jgi:teichuronic acid biosynthesis glycosyltransferase TuaC
MKILIVCSGNHPGFDFRLHQAFIYDQIEAVCKNYKDIEYDLYLVKGKGITGYLSNLPRIKKKIKEYSPDLVHAHGGHIGILCALQRISPVVTTLHGSDVDYLKNRIISMAASFFGAASIFVSEQLYTKAFFKGRNSSVVPCGVDLTMFYPVEKQKACLALGFNEDFRYVLFSSWFGYPEKNYPLACKAMTAFPDLPLLEIKNRSRKEVNLLINGSELLLMTSYTEGSPQIIKEAMACNCPIVTTDVGDVRQVLQATEGTYICKQNALDIAEKMRKAIDFGRKTEGREKIRHLDNTLVAEKIVNIYRKTAKK